jgi:hypothetical protein
VVVEAVVTERLAPLRRAVLRLRELHTGD